jgi:hypothetical protein
MSGVMADLNLRIAAEVAVAQFRALREIADDYGEPAPGVLATMDQLEEMLDAGDISGLMEALPAVMGQLGQAMQEEQPDG